MRQNVSRQQPTRQDGPFFKALNKCQLVKQEQVGRENCYVNHKEGRRQIVDSFRSIWDKKFNQLDAVLKNAKTKNHDHQQRNHLH